MTLNRAKHVYGKAQTFMNEIEKEYLLCLENKRITLDLQSSIKFFLSAVRDPLDYYAFSIFDSFCSKYIEPSKLKQAEKSIGFPVYSDQTQFHVMIQRKFVNLNVDRPDIYDAFTNCQTFSSGSPSWLKQLNSLNNKNKHRDLSPQRGQEELVNRIVDTETNETSIQWADDVKSITITGNTFNGKPLDYNNSTDSVHKESGLIKVQALDWNDIFFTELNKPILDTLNELYREVGRAINIFDELLR